MYDIERNYQMKRNLTSYYRSIRHCLPCSSKLKKQILTDIKTQVNTYMEENPSADCEIIKQHFGTPQQIATAYIDEMTTQEIQKRFTIKKTTIVIVCIAIGLIVAMWATALISAWIDAQKSFDGFYDVGPVIESDVEESK